MNVRREFQLLEADNSFITAQPHHRKLVIDFRKTTIKSLLHLLRIIVSCERLLL